jgi:hypothetical protein
MKLITFKVLTPVYGVGRRQPCAYKIRYDDGTYDLIGWHEYEMYKNYDRDHEFMLLR